MQSVKLPSAISEYSEARILRNLNNPCLQCKHYYHLETFFFLKNVHQWCYVLKNAGFINEKLAAWCHFWEEYFLYAELVTGDKKK